MNISENGKKLRIYLGESDQVGHKPLYEVIVLAAREQGLAGATVLRSPMGFGHSSRIHTAKILRLSEDLPIIVEIIDNEAKIKTFMQNVEKLIHGGLVTIEDVQVLHYGTKA